MPKGTPLRKKASLAGEAGRKMKNKNFKKIVTVITILIIGFNSVLPYRVSPTFAEDSPEEIARQVEEAQREADRRAQNAADEAARQASEDAREAVEDLSPTPTPLPQPTAIIVDPTAAPLNTDSVSTTDNNNSSNSDTSVDNSNTGELNNNVNTEANTGDNVISGDNPPTPTPSINNAQTQDPLPQCEDNLQNSADVAGEENNLLYDSGEVNQDTTAQNDQPVSENSTDSSTTDNDTVTVSNSNCASLQNDQQVNSTTGSNDASNNEGSEMQTGSSEADSTLINEGNKNISSSDTTSDGSQQVQGDVSTTNNDQVTVDNNNQIYAQNDVVVESTSGGNTINDNDGNAELSTGDVDMMVTLLNILNLNLTGEDFTHLIVNIFGDLTGDVDLDKIASSLGMSEEEIQAIAKNELTQQEEHDQKKAEHRLAMDVNNDNQAQVQNNVDVSGTSGDNELSGNEDRTKLVTGRIKILVALINFINTNYSGTQWYFAMVNIFGSLKGDLILPDPNAFLIDESNSTSNETAGADTSNTNQDTMNVSNQNQATVTNNINVTGDSGSNNAYSNEDRVTQDTGKVDVVTQLTNWLNVNIFGDNWVLLVINVFGTWYGKIVGFPGQGTVDAPQSGMLMVGAGGEGGGPTITNNTGDTQNSQSNNWDVNNQNSATVENNVNVSGLSGGNSTNNNEDPVSVSTGWIDISTNLLNIVNMNVTGKKWMLVLVNIFGDFFGDITFPGVKKAAVSEFNSEGEVTGQSNDNSSNIGGVSSQEKEAAIIITITPTPSTKIELLAYVQSQTPEIQEPSVEVYKAIDQPDSDISSQGDNTNTTKILGISVTTNRSVQQALFLMALITYLIALRLWAFKKVDS